MINDILGPPENLGKTLILHSLHGSEKTGKTGQNSAKLGKSAVNRKEILKAKTS